jgi:hypothetical protein
MVLSDDLFDKARFSCKSRLTVYIAYWGMEGKPLALDVVRVVSSSFWATENVGVLLWMSFFAFQGFRQCSQSLIDEES